MESEKNKFNEQIRERTFRLAVSIHGLLVAREVTSVTRPALNQIIRSSASVACNYRAATRSRSDAEFFSKICIVVEECDETQFWLDYLIRIGVILETEARKVCSEVDELIRLFTTIKKTMKQKLDQKK